MLASISLPTAVSPRRAVNGQPGRTSNADTALDRALVSRFTGGDESAFVEIMTRHRAKIQAVTLGMLRNRTDAEEVTQDTFIRAHRGLRNFRGYSSFATWLYRIAVNLARNRYWYFFRRRRQDAISLDCTLSEGSAATLADLVADTGPDPAQESAANEFAVLVDRSMACLDERQREILTLRNVRNQSYEEIGAALGLNIGTVKSRIARARGRLRLHLAEACPEFANGADPAQWFSPARPVSGPRAATGW